MASYRIHEDTEDQENRHALDNRHIAAKGDFHRLQERTVLGNKTNEVKEPKKPLNERFGNNVAISVPVEEFEAFKVDEEKPGIKKNVGIPKGRKSPEKVDKPIIYVDHGSPRPPAAKAEPKPVNRIEKRNDSPRDSAPTKDVELKRDETLTDLRNNIIYIKEYSADIYKYMRECENRHRPKPNYMNKQPDITYSMRTVLVDWLVEVAEEYKLHAETLFLAVSYIDRFLSYMSVVRAKLQLVGTSAMFIASKYEEIYAPDIGEFVYITDDTYNKKQVLRMEHLILKVLSFDLSVPTSLTFVKYFCASMDFDDRILHLAMYISELSLLEADPYLQYLPSVIAAAAIALARYTLDMEPWSSDYEEATGYTIGHLQPCLAHLYKTFANASLLEQKAIQDKYKQAKFSHVAMISPIEPNFLS